MIKGCINLLLGTVEAGKSTELHRILDTYVKHPHNPRILCITHTNDNRYGTGASITHTGRKRDALVAETLEECDVSNADIIAIEEGHFFPNLTEIVTKWADEGKYVIVVVLKANFRRKKFENVDIGNLIAVSDIITPLYAVCRKCGESAAHAHSLQEYDESSSDIKPGGSELFEPLCRSCYIKVTIT